MNIEDMFKQRDNIFYKETETILNQLSPVISAATGFITSTYGDDVNRVLEWEGVNLIEGIINLVGVVSYAPGTKLMFNDELMNITEDNVEYFQQMIRIGIPLSIATTNSETQVREYLEKIQSEAEVEFNEVNDVGYGFNLDKLTDVQREAFDYAIINSNIN